MSLSKPIKEQRKKNLLFALAMLGGYLIVYLAGRIFGTTSEPVSVIGWLFGTDPKQLSYLYGWLLHQHLFFACCGSIGGCGPVGETDFCVYGMVWLCGRPAFGGAVRQKPGRGGIRARA